MSKADTAAFRRVLLKWTKLEKTLSRCIRSPTGQLSCSRKPVDAHNWIFSRFLWCLELILIHWLCPMVKRWWIARNLLDHDHYVFELFCSVMLNINVNWCFSMKPSRKSHTMLNRVYFCGAIPDETISNVQRYRLQSSINCMFELQPSCLAALVPKFMTLKRCWQKW